MNEERAMGEQDEMTERLSAFADGELSGPERTLLLRQLTEDPAARERLAEILDGDERVRTDVQAALDTPPPPELRAAVAKGFARRRAARRGRGAALWGAAAAAVVMVAVGLGAIDSWIERRAVELAEAERDKLTALVRLTVQQALEQVESGQRFQEISSDADATVAITPMRTYQSASQHWCREFEERVTEDGRQSLRNGLACRDDNGVWRRVRTIVEGDLSL